MSEYDGGAILIKSEKLVFEIWYILQNKILNTAIFDFTSLFLFEDREIKFKQLFQIDTDHIKTKMSTLRELHNAKREMKRKLDYSC